MYPSRKIKRTHLLIYLVFTGLVSIVALLLVKKVNAPPPGLHQTESVIQSDGRPRITTGEENELLAYVLGYKSKEGYFIVNPRTHIIAFALPSIMKDQIEVIKKQFGSAEIVDDLFRKNDGSALISLKSDERQGYRIASDDEYRRFLIKNRQEWLQLIQEDPKLSGVITVSIPAYHKQSGILIVYMKIATSFNSAKGYIMEFELKEKQPRLLKELVVWNT